MKTKEEIKKEFKAVRGYDLPIYTYNGELGVLYEENRTGYAWAIEFIPMDEFLAKDDIDFENVRWVTIGADVCQEGEEITDDPIRCEENSQKLVVDSAWSPVSVNKSDKYIRELYVTTDRYYDWTSERTRMYKSIRDCLIEYDEDLCYYDGCADDELDADEIEERDKLAASLKSEIRLLKKYWEETCAKYEDPEEWAEYESGSIDFKDLLNDVYCDCASIVWNNARAAVNE